MTDRFTGRTALVTGASRGIGRAIAERLLAEGANVVVTARGEEDLASLVEAHGAERVAAVAGNIGDDAHRERLFAEADARFGGIDLLVNNVGINPVFGPMSEITYAAALKILETNVLGATRLVQLAVAHGLPSRDGAAIVNVASIAGVASAPGIGMYGVSKSALIGLTRQFARELAPRVRVNAVAPAAVRTKFAAALLENEEQLREAYPLARIGEPEDIAGPATFLLSRDAAGITGQCLVIDGGASLIVGE